MVLGISSIGAGTTLVATERIGASGACCSTLSPNVTRATAPRATPMSSAAPSSDALGSAWLVSGASAGGRGGRSLISVAVQTN